MRALIVTNMYPSPARPALGSFVADQVAALRRLADREPERAGEPALEIDVFAFDPGGTGAYAGAARRLAALRRGHPGGSGHAGGPGGRYDIVHAHFGLSAWPALAAPARARLVTLHGTDLAHPRSRPVTLAGLRLQDLVGVVSESLGASIPAWASRGRTAVLPCGVDLHRFGRVDKAECRRRLGLDPAGPYLLFAADPARPEKRHDLARAVAGDVPLLTLGNVPPADVPLWMNAANAVLTPSDREGYGLAVLEALACDVPVLATPVGIAPQALAGIDGTLCAPFDVATWQTALAPHLAADDPRVAGRARAQAQSSDVMAERVLATWQALLGPGR